MAIAYRASAVGTNATTGANTTVTLPGTIQAGDLILLLWADGGGTLVTQTTPTGYTVIPNVSINGTNDGTDGWYKTAVSGDAGATVTVASSVDGTSANKRILFAVVYSGAQLGNSASHQDTSASTSHTAPAATAVSASAWVVNLFMDRAGPGSTSFTLPANLTQRQFFAHTSTAACSAVVADDDLVGSGSKGANTATGTVSTANAAELTVILEPKANAAPTATASASPNTGVDGWATVTLTGSGSDSDGTVASYGWTCDDASVTFANPASASTTAVVPAQIAAHTYTFTLTVTDNLGATGTATCTVAVLPATVRSHSGGAWHAVRVKQTTL